MLPLKNLSGDPEQRYLADGMTEALITELSKHEHSAMIFRRSAIRYAGTEKPLQEIARELDVDTVFEGSVMLAGDRHRVTVHLDRVSPDGLLWPSSYDRSVRDLLDLQYEVPHRSRRIQFELTPEEHARLASIRPIDPKAAR